MKQVFICGNLGSNAVRRTTSDGRELMTFSVAVNDRNNNVTWFNCVSTFRESQFSYLIKGQGVSVIGDLSLRIYQNSVDASVSVDRLELVGGRKDDAQPTPQQDNDAPQGKVTATY